MSKYERVHWLEGHLQDVINEQREKLASVTTQRDKLLAAAKRAEYTMGKFDDDEANDYFWETLNILTAAIAGCEKEDTDANNSL